MKDTLGGELPNLLAAEEISALTNHCSALHNQPGAGPSGSLVGSTLAALLTLCRLASSFMLHAWRIQIPLTARCGRLSAMVGLRCGYGRNSKFHPPPRSLDQLLQLLRDELYEPASIGAAALGD
jgi:hypothetical protein